MKNFPPLEAPPGLELRQPSAAFGKYAPIESASSLARSKPLLRVHKALLCLAVWSLTAVHLQAADAAVTFDNANKLYEERKFAEAAAAYETILHAGQTSPALYFNLGNALFKSGKLGQAILAYRRAGQLTPRDPDVRANLQFARNQVQGPTLHPTRSQRFFGTLSLNEWAMLNGASLWLTFLLLAAVQLRPVWKPALRSLTLVAGGATLLVAACLAISLTISGASSVAVVTAKEITVRNGPLEESQSAFSAQDGAELQVLDRKDDWLQVSDGARRVGWVKRSEVGFVTAS